MTDDRISRIETNLAVTTDRLSRITELYEKDAERRYDERKEWLDWREEVDGDRIRFKQTARVLGALWVLLVALLGLLQSIFPGSL